MLLILFLANTTIGLGSGSTVFWLIRGIGKTCAQGFSIKIVPTSNQTKKLAEKAGIGSVDLNDVDSLPLTIDGADEIDEAISIDKRWRWRIAPGKNGGIRIRKTDHHC